MDDIWGAAGEASITEVLSRLGLGTPNSAHKVLCWAHSENTPSVHIFTEENRWFAFCCGAGGDVIDLVRSVMGGSRYASALWILQLEVASVVRPVAQHRPEPKDFTHWVRSNNEPTAETWGPFFARWPIDMQVTELVATWGLRCSGEELFVPHWNAGDSLKCFGVKVRSWDGAKYARTGSKFRHLYRSPLRLTSNQRPVVVVCEGESDAWCATAALQKADDVEVVAMPAGALSSSPYMVRALREFSHVITALDGDDVGSRGTDRLYDALFQDVDFSVLDVPGGRVAEALADGWDMNRAVAMIR